MVEELLAPLLETRWGRRAGVVTLVGSALFFCMTFVGIVLSWHQDIRVSHASLSAVGFTSESTESISKRIVTLPEQHLFGGHYVASESTSLPITSMQLRLLGVSVAVPEKYSKVIISESDHPGRVYRVGDILDSGVKVYAISRDGVILDNAGRLEKLPLQRKTLGE